MWAVGYRDTMTAMSIQTPSPTKTEYPLSGMTGLIIGCAMKVHTKQENSESRAPLSS